MTLHQSVEYSKWNTENKDETIWYANRREIRNSGSYSCGCYCVALRLIESKILFVLFLWVFFATDFEHFGSRFFFENSTHWQANVASFRITMFIALCRWTFTMQFTVLLFIDFYCFSLNLNNVINVIIMCTEKYI